MSDQLTEVLERELDVADLFRGLGYFAVAHIDIYPFEESRMVSDIDVLGISFDHELMSTRIIAEAKERGCKATDIMKLYGLGTYFGNAKLYFVTSSTSKRCLKVAQSLGVRLTSKDKLKEILGKPPKHFVRSNPVAFRKTIDHLSELKFIDSNLYWTYHYLWMERDPYLRLHQQQHLFDLALAMADNNKLKDAAEWFCKDLFIKSVVSVIEIASDSIALPEDSIQPYIEDRFYNLGTDRRGKEKIRDGVKQLIDIIDSLSGGEVHIPEIELVPAYLPILIDLVLMIRKSTKYVNLYLLRDYDVYLLELNDNPTHISEIVSPSQYKFLSKFNDRLARLLHNGPISINFQNFI